MPPNRDRPQPRHDQPPEAEEIMALGLITGALSVSPPVIESRTLIMQMVLANRAGEHPRLFLRFPGVLKSEYEVTLHMVPDTALAEGDERVDA